MKKINNIIILCSKMKLKKTAKKMNFTKYIYITQIKHWRKEILNWSFKNSGNWQNNEEKAIIKLPLHIMKKKTEENKSKL